MCKERNLRQLAATRPQLQIALGEAAIPSCRRVSCPRQCRAWASAGRSRTRSRPVTAGGYMAYATAAGLHGRSDFSDMRMSNVALTANSELQVRVEQSQVSRLPDLEEIGVVGNSLDLGRNRVEFASARSC